MASLVAGLGAVWLWYNIKSSGLWLFRGVRWGFEKMPFGEKLYRCPWCLGAWLAFGLYLLYGGRNVVEALAAAGIAGLLGSAVEFIASDGVEE